MTQSDKPLNPTRKPSEVRILKDDELETVSGGSETAQLSNAVSNTIKAFGNALSSMASKG